MSAQSPSMSDVAATRLPITQASTLSGFCYTSQEWYEREVEKIFSKEWICIGRAEEVAQTGDYFTVDLVGEPIVVVRDRSGVIRAHSAVCRHRGAVVVGGEGNCKVFQCPYHNWTYSLEGKLLSTPGRPHPLDDVENFDPEKYGLHALRIEEWAGFLFVNLDSEARSLRTSLGDLPERLENFKLGDMRRTRRVVHELPANWKSFVENDIEEYHTETVHKKHLDPLNSQSWKVEETNGPYEVLYGTGSLGMRNTMGLPEIQGLSQKEKEGVFFIWVPPNMVINLTPYFMLYRLHFPEGPNKDRAVMTQCFPKSEVSDGDPGMRNPQFYSLKDEVLLEDIDICRNVLRGLKSRFYRPGRYSPREAITHRVANYVLERVLGS
jgi:choline monooxygenase